MARRDDDDDRDGGSGKAEATAHLVQGLSHLFRAAKVAAAGVRRGVEKTNASRTIDDAGRELGRALGNVARRLGEEIERVGGVADGPGDAAAWPATREAYERAYGPVDGDWPRSADEYERRFGKKPHPPDEKPKGPTPSDPGFTMS